MIIANTTRKLIDYLLKDMEYNTHGFGFDKRGYSYLFHSYAHTLSAKNFPIKYINGTCSFLLALTLLKCVQEHIVKKYTQNGV